MSKSIDKSLPLGRSLAILVKIYFGALAKRLEHLEIERYYSILILIENTGRCTQQFICDQLKIDKVSMVRIMDHLIEKKYVKKMLNPNDRREYFVELTSKGTDRMPEIHSAIAEVNQVAFKGLSKECQNDFYKSIALMQQNLEELPSQKIFINYKKANKKI
jgi:DNA-binding MarR family transcriptional regulator